VPILVCLLSSVQPLVDAQDVSVVVEVKEVDAEGMRVTWDISNEISACLP